LRRLAVAFLVLILLAAPFAGEAQPATKVARIGFLSPLDASSVSRNYEAFKQGLREVGWVEGRNIAIEARWAEGRPNRLPALAAELVRAPGRRHHGADYPSGSGGEGGL
jgi:putative tryptophan/tyrosine transport system substrate-binding protein